MNDKQISECLRMLPKHTNQGQDLLALAESVKRAEADVQAALAYLNKTEQAFLEVRRTEVSGMTLDLAADALLEARIDYKHTCHQLRWFEQQLGRERNRLTRAQGL